MSDSLPGISAIKETEEVSLFASGPDNNHGQFSQRATIASTVTDSGNTPTTTLRGGLIMGVRTSDGLAYKYDATAGSPANTATAYNIGDNVPTGIVPKHTYMLDKDGTAENKFSKLYTAGIIRNVDDLPNADQHTIAVLGRIGFRFAQLDPHGSLFGFHTKATHQFSAGNALTITAAHHGCTLVSQGTGAFTFTLPTLGATGITPGFQVQLFNAVNQNMVVTGAANKIVYAVTTGNATTLTWSTANNLIGASVLLTVGYDNGTTPALVWYPTMIQRTVTAS